MRKLISFSLMTVVLLAWAACSKPKGPAESMIECFMATNDGDFKTLYEGINPDCEKMKMAKEQANDSVSFFEHFEETNKREFGRRLGVKDIQIFGTTLSEQGDTAFVDYKLTFGNGEVVQDKGRMVKLNGKWYMDN